MSDRDRDPFIVKLYLRPSQPWPDITEVRRISYATEDEDVEEYETKHYYPVGDLIVKFDEIDNINDIEDTQLRYWIYDMVSSEIERLRALIKVSDEH